MTRKQQGSRSSASQGYKGGYKGAGFEPQTFVGTGFSSGPAYCFGGLPAGVFRLRSSAAASPLTGFETCRAAANWNAARWVAFWLFACKPTWRQPAFGPAHELSALV